MRKITLAILVLTLTALACGAPATPEYRRETITLGTTNPNAASRVDEAGNPDPVPAPVATFDAPCPAMDWLAENDLGPSQYILVTTYGPDQVAMLRAALEGAALRNARNIYIVIPPGTPVCLVPLQSSCPPTSIPLLVTPTGDWRVLPGSGADWDVRIRVTVRGEGSEEVLGSISPLAWPSPFAAYDRWVSIRRLREQEYEFAGELTWTRVIERIVETGTRPEHRALRRTAYQMVVVVGAAVLISAIPVPSPDDVLWLTLAGAAVAP